MQKIGQDSTSCAIPATGLPDIPPEVLRNRIAAGARCVRFEYCISFGIATVRQQSAIHVTSSWRNRCIRGLRYSFLTLVAGPWGIPWGLIWSPWAIWVNLTGGVDVTDKVLSQLSELQADFPRS